MSSTKLYFDLQSFTKRHKMLIQMFTNKSGFDDVSALAFMMGQDQIMAYNKTSAIFEWLFGYDLQDTLVLVSPRKTVIVTGKRKAEFLDPILKLGHEIELVIRNRDESLKDLFGPLLSKINFEFTSSQISLGLFEKDRFGGPFSEAWYTYLEGSKFKKFDVSSSISNLLSIKDDQEFKIVKLASSVSSEIYTRFAKSRILDIIDSEKKIKHVKLSSEIDNAIEDTSLHQPLMASSEVESCYPPIIQSGGKYNLRFSATSDSNNLTYDCIICFIGVRYKYYCSSIVRTLMVKPSDELKSVYSFLLELHDIFLKNLKPANRFCDIYSAIQNLVITRYPKLSENFVRSLGFVTGLEFRDINFLIDQNNTNVVKPGMIFSSLIGFQNFKLSDSEKTACVAVGDTVAVNPDGSVVEFTSAKKSLGSSSVLINDSHSSRFDMLSDNAIKNAPIFTQSRIRQPNTEAMLNEEQRKIHQAELKERLNEEARQRLINNEVYGNKKTPTGSKNFLGSYKSAAYIPNVPDVLSLKIHVDKRSETIIFPICGMSVPFHISTIKSVSSNVEGGHIYLRVNFNIISGPNSKIEDLSITYGKNVYVKEMIYRGSYNSYDNSHSNLVSTFNQIKELQKTFKSRLQEESEMEGVIKQADLIIDSTKMVPRLKDLVMRPQIGTRRTVGVLEAHTNGFRYFTSASERVDILYNNIKHAFFQPCDHEVVITIHFHLCNPIMIGKKKSKDIQFFTEVGEVVSDLGRTVSNMLDRDEIEAEETERETRNKLKMMFKGFVERVESAANGQVVFEVPFRELGFYGVPNKASVLLVPTTHCLINIIDQPPFIISLEDIELVHFERVTFQMKNFDMILVFKNYQKRVCMISSIPIKYLEPIKDWLNSCDIKYTEGTQNLNWAKIMKTILDDPEEFFATGGWSFLDPDSNDESAGLSEDQDEEYKPQSSEEEENYEDESNSDSEDYESERSDSSEVVSEEDDTESGKSWSELEEEARAMDAIKHGGSYSPVGKRKILPKYSVQKKRRA